PRRTFSSIMSTTINLVQPGILRYKVYEPVIVVGEDKVATINIRVRTEGRGLDSQ
ncbi:hypothetical protein SISSUDRAFT_957306, partial [Sistotremastrum suecicum HHB10207 ss-3]